MARSGAWRAFVAALGLAWLAGCAPEGPAAVAWDRVACAHCRMLVSDPRFAAQLRLESGETLVFDDPGCLLLARAKREGVRGAAWFHDSAGEGWIVEAEAAFVRGATTPMGYGLAAVRAAGAPDALTASAALAEIAASGGSPR